MAAGRHGPGRYWRPYVPHLLRVQTQRQGCGHRSGIVADRRTVGLPVRCYRLYSRRQVFAPGICGIIDRRFHIAPLRLVYQSQPLSDLGHANHNGADIIPACGKHSKAGPRQRAGSGEKS